MLINITPLNLPKTEIYIYMYTYTYIYIYIHIYIYDKALYISICPKAHLSTCDVPGTVHISSAALLRTIWRFFTSINDRNNALLLKIFPSNILYMLQNSFLNMENILLLKNKSTLWLKTESCNSDVLSPVFHPLSHLTFIRLSGSASAPTRQSLWVPIW